MELKYIFDTEGRKIFFEKLGVENYIYNAKIDKAKSREIPTGQIFNIFGKDKIIKVQPIDNETILLSILNSGHYVHPWESNVLTVTHYKSEKMMKENFDGECVDTLICPAFDEHNSFILVPYIYDLPILKKMIYTVCIGLFISIIVYFSKDKEYIWVVLFFLKDNICRHIMDLFIYFV